MARLEGMNQIKDYVKRSEATVLGYIRLQEFPAVKLGGIWVSDSKKIDRWFDDQLENGRNGTTAPAEPSKSTPKTPADETEKSAKKSAVKKKRQ